MENSHFFILKKLKWKEKSDNGSYFYGTQLPIIFFNSKINLIFSFKKPLTSVEAHAERLIYIKQKAENGETFKIPENAIS